MRFLISIIVPALLLMACTRAPSNDRNILVEQKKPRIPSADELKASVLDFQKKPAVNEHEVDRILAEIAKKETNEPITYDDIRRGWYSASKDQKKEGTPKAWQWIQVEQEGRWVSPEAAELLRLEKEKKECSNKGGVYRISCLESESEGCEYIPESRCESPTP